MFFFSFINGWWPLRDKPNVLMLHFSDMKKDHEGSIRKIADFLGFSDKLSEQQWAKVLLRETFSRAHGIITLHTKSVHRIFVVPR